MQTCEGSPIFDNQSANCDRRWADLDSDAEDEIADMYDREEAVTTHACWTCHQAPGALQF
ncbi:unnamed protein product [Symbiodinium natans]|uniref:Uncharacterized protein n=1 Tax=Symbiodinium natans TaxID=878477 RepID=A0A812R4K1_9DINO|nr:unnamed protein product [Symbiodinium natans]